MKNLIKIVLIVVVFLIIPVFGVDASGELEEKCDRAEISVIARDFFGKFIPNLVFEIYEQVFNVDGDPRPDKRVAAGKIDPYLGKGTVSLNVENHNQFAVKMYDKVSDKNKFSFWFYNDLNAGCGAVMSVTEELNGMKFIFQDSNEKLKKNIKFSLYEQLFDNANSPLQEKGSLVGIFNSGGSGSIPVYIPHSNYTVDETGNNRFVLEAKNEKGNIFTQYDIVIPEDSTKEIIYTFSSMKLSFRDSNNKIFLPGKRVKIYNQENSGEFIGKIAGTFYTDSRGEVFFEYPAGTYVAQIEESGKNVNFFNLEVKDKKNENYNLKVGSDVKVSNICSALDFTLNLKRVNSQYVVNSLNFELYQQETDQTGRKMAGAKLASGKTDSNGIGKISIRPDEYRDYALKVYSKNSKVGDYWFFNTIKFECGLDKEITKNLPILTVILRDGGGELIRNKRFSIYTQKLDVDSNPIKEKEDLVSLFSTNEKGAADIFIASNHLYNKEKKGVYILTVVGENKAEFLEYDINVPLNTDVIVEYTLSDLAVNIKSAGGNNLKGETVDLYKQKQDSSGRNVLGNKIGSYKTDDNGGVLIQYPTGIYALVVKDGVGKNNIFWDIVIENKKRAKKDMIISLISIGIKNVANKLVDERKNIDIYSMKEVSSGNYQVDRKIKTIKTGISKYAEISLAPGVYFFISEDEKQDYGIASYIENGKKQEIFIHYRDTNKVVGGQKFRVGPVQKNGGSSTLFERVKGRILLQVEDNGEAWYVDAKTSKRYYMKNGMTAYDMMRKFGLGITNNNLEKIPVGVDGRFNEIDSDSDGISDKMEEALGTNIFNSDTDGDGYKDGEEIKNGYNPRGNGRININSSFANNLKGKILLQVESKGEAWYISPDDGRRYYMKNGDSAYKIMRFLSLGITNVDLLKINKGVLN